MLGVPQSIPTPVDCSRLFYTFKEHSVALCTVETFRIISEFWPTRPPHVIPSHFSVWGVLKRNSYTNKCRAIEDVIEKTRHQQTDVIPEGPVMTRSRQFGCAWPLQPTFRTTRSDICPRNI